MSVEDTKARDQMLSLLKKPKPMQIFRMSEDHNLPKFYNATVVVDKEDRISIIRKQYQLMIGSNGCFIKEKPTQKSGITYHKTGRSSARLKYWNSYVHKRDRYDLLKQLAAKVNPDTKHVLDYEVIEKLGTTGMYGYILAGNITNITEAMEYYIRYSMRGSGIRQDMAHNLYTYLSGSESKASASMVLRNVVDPNAILSKFSTSSTDATLLLRSIDTNGHRLARMAASVGEKIDYLKPGFSPIIENERLSIKIDKFKSYFDVWEGGPVLFDKKARIPDDLPF